MSTDTATGYAIHPLAALIPQMTEPEFAELVADIKANGQLQPILIYEHQVLDGRHRLRACEQLGLAPRTETYEGDEPAAHVLSLNLRRRHLSSSQRAMIATDFLPHLEREARARMAQAGASAAPGRPSIKGVQASTPFEPGGRAADKAAAQVGVSPSLVYQAKRIAQQMPEAAEEIRAGVSTITQANEQIKAASRAETEPSQPKPERSEWQRGRKRIDSNRILSSLATELDAATSGLDLMESDQIDPDVLDECMPLIEQSIQTIRRHLRRIQSA
jgi:hypothetical protein